MKFTETFRPLPAEQALGVRPEPALRVDAAQWKRRALFATGRVLTPGVLQHEQWIRAARVGLLVRGLAPGVVHGLDVAPALAGRAPLPDESDPRSVHGPYLDVRPGMGVTRGGEDVWLPRGVRLDTAHVPVAAGSLAAAAAWSADDRLRLQQAAASGRSWTLPALRAEFPGVALPAAAVLVARPITLLRDRSDVLANPCLPTEEERLEASFFDDALRFEWHLWPALTDPLPPVDARWRNRLVWRVFDRHARSERWPWEQTLVVGDGIEADGVALALAGLDWTLPTLPPSESDTSTGSPLPLAPVALHFVDRMAVVREGGGRRARSTLVATQHGDEPLWQAQVLQFAEHWNALPAPTAGQTRADQIAAAFDRLPPTGLLPADVVDFEAGRQHLFPAGWQIEARPVPEELAEPLMAEAASLAPLSLGRAEALELLVPVPAAQWEPDLLRLDEAVHPLFATEIRRLENERDAAGRERDAWRRRLDAFTHAASGQWPAYMDIEDGALADEAGVAKARLFRRLHRGGVARQNVLQAHGFAGAQETLQLQAGDRLSVYVRPAAGAPPAYLLLQAIARTLDDQGRAQAVPGPVFWWGAAGAGAPTVAGVPASSVRAAGTLPAAASTPEWLRLEVDASHLGVDASQPELTLEGLCFGVIAGAAGDAVAWGYAGSLNAGRERLWVTDALPAGADVRATANTMAAGHTDDWPWQAALADVVKVDGYAEDGDRRTLTDVDNLLVAAARNAARVELQQPVAPDAQGVTPSPHNRVLDLGLARLIETLDAKGRESNDLVDFGFLRARVDLYRLRARLLGEAEGDRLLTSPAVAELVKRSATTYATEQVLTEYLGKAAATPVPPTSAPAPRALAPSAMRRAARSAAAAAPAEGNVEPRLRARALATGSFGSATATGTRVVSAPIASVPAVIAPTPAPAPGVVSGKGDLLLATAAEREFAGFAGIAPAPPPKVSDGAVKVAASPSVDDVIKSGTYTVSQNETTIAERMSGVPVVEAWSAAVQGKLGGVNDTAARLTALGMPVDGVRVYGFSVGDKPVADIGQFLAAGNDVRDEDADDTNLLSEADYFTKGLNALDNGLRFFRGVESLVEQYRSLSSLCQTTLARLQVLQQQCLTAIAALERRLAELRHDLGVARALLVEEQQRIAALLAHRRAVLAEVRFVAYRRPRLANRFDDVPSRGVECGRFVSPVPACRAGTHAVPPEIQRMTQALRDLPARWFRPLADAIRAVTDRDELFELIAHAPAQATLRQAQKVVTGVAADAPAATKAVAQVRASVQQRAVQHADAVRTLDTASLSTASWSQLTLVALDALTPADLLGARRTLATSGLLDDIAGVASCLHRSMQTVPPALRLQWATLLSAFDLPPALRDLTVLPGFGRTEQGLDHGDWRAMQALVDWLFSCIDATNAEAVRLMNDLVRVAILLASQAPVKGIVPARLLQPVRPAVGTVVQLSVDLMASVQVGMRVDFAPQTGATVASAVIEDVAPARAVARFTQVSSAAELAGENTVVQVHTQTTQAVSAAASQRAGGGAQAAAGAGFGMATMALRR